MQDYIKNGTVAAFIARRSGQIVPDALIKSDNHRGGRTEGGRENERADEKIQYGNTSASCLLIPKSRTLRLNLRASGGASNIKPR